jgi:glycosyltransferase involved in cell wall biosynthesis
VSPADGIHARPEAERLKVAHLDTGRTWRGGQAQALLLMRELRARGVDQVLLAPPGPLLDRALVEGFEVERWSPRNELDVFAIGHARAILRGFAPNVAHAHSAHAHATGVPAARWAGVPAVVVSRRVDFRVRTNLFSRYKYAMQVDRYLCISEGVRAAMIASGVEPSRLSLVPSGLDLLQVRRDGARAAPSLREIAGLPPDAEIIGTVASLAPHKNHTLLLDAAREVVTARPRAHFVWLGEGECRAALERQRAALGLESRVHMLGFRDDALALMTQFDVFALASYLEGLCTSLLDAQALGVPIVATGVGGVPEVVTDGRTGRLVHALEPSALARALVGALADPAQRAAWAEAARSSVEAFGIAFTAERTLAVYREVLGARAAPS